MKAFSVPTVVTVFFLVMCLGRECWTQVDLTLVPREKGSDVVLAVVAKIECSEVFPTDNRLLRRMAYVESKDGPTVILIGLKIAITAESGKLISRLSKERKTRRASQPSRSYTDR